MFRVNYDVLHDQTYAELRNLLLDFGAPEDELPPAEPATAPGTKQYSDCMDWMREQVANIPAEDLWVGGYNFLVEEVTED